MLIVLQACYVHLSDVPAGDNIRARDSAFRLSRWHTRGWTLQELLAPEVVIFLAQNWDILSTKTELAEVISQVTWIPVPVLTFERDIADVSIAQRMSWAGDRKTTREEDQAYCLLGIFGISMPTLYGEGRKAFYRLQEELMKTSTDTSLFAWGVYATKSFFNAIPPPNVESKQKYCSSTLHPSTTTYLLAMSPIEFLVYDQIRRTFKHNPIEASDYYASSQSSSLNDMALEFRLLIYGRPKISSSFKCMLQPRRS